MEDYISDYFDEQSKEMDHSEDADLRFKLMFKSNVDYAALSTAIQNIEHPKITLLSVTPINTTLDMSEILGFILPIERNEETKN